MQKKKKRYSKHTFNESQRICRGWEGVGHACCRPHPLLIPRGIIIIHHLFFLPLFSIHLLHRSEIWRRGPLSFQYLPESPSPLTTLLQTPNSHGVVVYRPTQSSFSLPFPFLPLRVRSFHSNLCALIQIQVIRISLNSAFYDIVYQEQYCIQIPR